MINRLSYKTVLFAALLTLAAALPALAADPHHPETDAKPAAAHDMGQMKGQGGMMGGQGGMMGNMNPYAQLTPEKQAAAAAIDKAFAAKAADIRQRMWAKNAEMEAVLAQPKADRKKAAALSKDLAALQGEMQDAMIDRRIKIAEETGITMPMGKGMMGPGMGGMMEMMGNMGGGMMEGGKCAMMQGMGSGHGQAATAQPAPAQ